jgi:tungstate transport system ATP-binding protein
LQNLEQRFDEKTVLDIDFLEIEQGYIYALLGPNGSGKTTLLNILGFLEKPSSGQLSFKGTSVSFTERALQPLRKKVVMVNQNPILFTTTVFKNLEFGLKIRSIPKLQRRKLIEEALELVGLRHLEQAPAHKLSGGETQRAVLARAMVLSPEVILCDEPTASVDLENQLKISRLLKDINQEKKITLVFTSHDKRQAASLPQHRIFLEQGKTSRHSYENIFPFHLLKDNTPLMESIRRFDSLQTGSKHCVPRERFRIDPKAIVVSALNGEELLPSTIIGNITRLSMDGSSIRIAISCGVRLTVVMPQDTYKNLRLLVGDQINIFIPESAVSLID